MKKAYTGELGNGVSYEKDRQNRASGEELEKTIEYIMKKLGMKVYRNLYLENKRTGRTMEVDILAISRKGIFVIESKNYRRCEVRGSVLDKDWVVNYRSGKTFRLYNPLKQTEGKVRYMERGLNLTDEIIPLVVFPNNMVCSINVQEVRGVKGDVINVNHLKDYVNSYGYNLSRREVKHCNKWVKDNTLRGVFKTLKHQKQVNKAARQ